MFKLIKWVVGIVIKIKSFKVKKNETYIIFKELIITKHLYQKKKGFCDINNSIKYKISYK